jgi:hypothetical protein
VKVPVLLFRERDLGEVEAGGLVEEGKVNIQAVTDQKDNGRPYRPPQLLSIGGCDGRVSRCIHFQCQPQAPT